MLSTGRIAMQIRSERDTDGAMIRAVVAAAFPTPAEAGLVAALRRQAWPFVSLVAVDGDAIVGHVMFSPVTLTGHPHLMLMGLAPISVVPDRQRAGIGAALVRAGFEECAALACDAIVVLGDPNYYGRFGFVPAARFAIDSEYDVAPEHFMVCELRLGVLAGASGRVAYHAAFADL